MNSKPTDVLDPAVASLGDNAVFAHTNHVRGVLAGIFAGASREFLHPEIILTGLIFALTGSPVLAALVPVINKVGFMGPQLVFGSWLEHLPRRKPAFVVVTVVRSASLFALVGSIGLLTLRGPDAFALVTFYIAYLLMCMASSSGHVVFTDMIGRLIPGNRVASFIGMRMMLGGVLAMVVAFLIIQPILGALDVPVNYLVLSLGGAILGVIDMVIWCTARECPGPAASRQPTLRESLRRGFGWLRNDAVYRHFLGTRIGFRISYLGMAFFIPFGERELAREGAAGVALLGGILVGIQKISNIAASGLWGKMTDRLGSRFTLVCGAIILTGAPLVAILATVLPVAYTIPVPGVERAIDLPLTVYMLALVLMTFGIRAQVLGGQRLLITNAPPDRRPTYVSFINTLTSPLTLLPLAGAAIVEITGMNALFGLICVGGLIMLTFSVTMQSDRPMCVRKT